MRHVLAIALVWLVSFALGVQTTAGAYKVNLRTEPEIVPIGRAELLISLTDSSGKPMSGATIRALSQMSGMSMGERDELAVAGPAPGQYSVPAVFAMSGTYDVTLSISGALGESTATLHLTTGEPSQEGGSPPFLSVVVVLILVLGSGFVLWRLKKTGHVFTPRALFTRQTLGSVILLGACVIAAVWAVNRFRRPGSMTPLEAQTMQMNAATPQGVLPVHLVKAEKSLFAETVTYNGQAVGYVDQDVSPRVSGTIVSMSVYVGSKVKKGQVVARLDTAVTDPMVNEKAADAQSAREGIGVAATEFQLALNRVVEARSELTLTRAEVAEANAMVESSRQSRSGAEAGVQSANSDVRAMQAELASTLADQTYQQQDLLRTKSLYDQNAVSRDEWQKAQSEAKKSDAAVERAKENVAKARAGERLAQAEVNKAQSEIVAALRRVNQAEAKVRAKEASIETAQAASEVARGKLSQSKAAATGATAGLQGATVQRGFSELRSEIDGVVTQRLIGPGTVVAPGQTVLKMSQISPIRLQANVPESDLVRIPIGATVKVTNRGSKDQPLIVKVSSVTPSVDPVSRTGVVEVVTANRNHRFTPGQYLSMEISVSGEQAAVVIPSTAVESREGRDTVWIATPTTNNRFSLSRQDVEVDGRSGDRVAIKRGIKPGQRVVDSPPQGLTLDTNVVSTDLIDVTVTNQTVEITAAGYDPPFVNVPANKAFRVTFIRRDDKTCGTEVIFPELSIRKALPLNQPVTVDIPAQPAGKEVHFTCPMNMLNGKAVAR